MFDKLKKGWAEAKKEVGLDEQKPYKCPFCKKEVRFKTVRELSSHIQGRHRGMAMGKLEGFQDKVKGVFRRK